ncbi:hypothetical protein [Salinicola sp. DM10]|uniref:hypothetical protein n=1 Tax=Salinicola sp. DM10 TaxID=2815721 RepID=UPI001A8CB894|nr:hypothetical protein [Salinicola sp. DM10]MCE3025723.1 hypothetical protein [Salinicola sp. DM10]
MLISHTGPFQGETPLIDPRISQAAAVSRNAYRRHGTLKAERGPAPSGDLNGVSRPGNLYRYDAGNDGAGFWFTWDRGKDVDAVRSPIANDAHSRVYWTGDGAPKMGGIDILTRGAGPYPSASYQLGVPAPEGAPSAAQPDDRVRPDDEAIDWPPLTAVDTVYVVTCITNYGEESAPSTASQMVTRWDAADDLPEGGDVIVTLPDTPSSNNNITAMRLYRSESGNEYQYVADVPVGTKTYRDAVRSEELGLVLPSTEWDMPAPEMRGLTDMGNGMLAGFYGNTVGFCVPYRPHAWPAAYELAFSDPVVAIATIPGGLVVLTTGQPSLVTGTDPAAMAQQRLDVQQSCVAKASVVSMGGYALYASPDGIVAAGGSEAKLVTGNVFSREQWAALNPATMHCYRFDGRYYAFHDEGCIAFAPGDGIDSFDVQAEAGYYDDQRDVFYLIQDDRLVAWGEGERLALRWRSPITQVAPGAGGFSCAKVIAAEYPVMMRLFADGQSVLETQIESASMVRLPAGFALCREWQTELETTGEIYAAHLATSASELP